MNNKPYVMPLDIGQAQVAVDALHAAEALCQRQPGPTSLRVYVEAKFEAGAWTAPVLAEVEQLREVLAKARADEARLSASLVQSISEREKALAEAERLRTGIKTIAEAAGIAAASKCQLISTEHRSGLSWIADDLDALIAGGDQ